MMSWTGRGQYYKYLLFQKNQGVKINRLFYIFVQIKYFHLISCRVSSRSEWIAIVFKLSTYDATSKVLSGYLTVFKFHFYCWKYPKNIKVRYQWRRLHRTLFPPVYPIFKERPKRICNDVNSLCFSSTYHRIIWLHGTVDKYLNLG